MEKRNKHITVNLTAEELELIERISQELERKPAELARILLVKAARQQWQNMSILESGPLQPITAQR